MTKEITDKVIIITGASSGIGRETARLLARERAQLVLVARRDALLQDLKREAEAAGATAMSLTLDLRREEDVDRMIRATAARFGRVDVLINNAAFGFYGTVESIPRAVVREIFALNFEAPLFATQLVIPIMRAQGSGHIINVSSIVGKRGLPLSGIYCATKFALDGLTQSLRLELRDAGINVSVVNPGATQTEFQQHIRRGDVQGTFKHAGHVQSAEVVAKSIVACIRHPKIEVYPYRFSRLLVWLNAFAPSLVDRVMVPYFRERMAAKTSA